MECICCEHASKYKCPICYQPYCSVACYKTHRSTPCTAPPPVESKDPSPLPQREEYNHSTEDTVPLERLKLLDNSEEVRRCLSNRHVRTILQELDSCAHPDAAIARYMTEPIFTEFVDACLAVVEPVEESNV